MRKSEKKKTGVGGVWGEGGGLGQCETLPETRRKIAVGRRPRRPTLLVTVIVREDLLPFHVATHSFRGMFFFFFF